MAKKRKTKKVQSEPDSLYLMKLVLFFVLGTFWVRIESESGSNDIALPLGLALGIIFAAHDHFQIDRKIEYAVLLMATFISYFLPVGVLI